MADVDLFAPLSSLQWVDREQLKPNDYNPNKVNRENLKLLVQSIMTNGWTLPIVVRPDYTIIDGFHRWTVAGEEPLHTMLKGKVPVVIVRHDDATEDIYGTVTHNRARGTHLLEPMKAIVKRLLDEGKSVQEIGKQLGMKPEEVFRLSDFSRDDFLGMMTKGVKGYILLGAVNPGGDGVTVGQVDDHDLLGASLQVGAEFLVAHVALRFHRGTGSGQLLGRPRFTHRYCLPSSSSTVK